MAEVRCSGFSFDGEICMVGDFVLVVWPFKGWQGFVSMDVMSFTNCYYADWCNSLLIIPSVLSKKK